MDTMTYILLIAALFLLGIFVFICVETPRSSRKKPDSLTGDKTYNTLNVQE
jgi:hypothetical protein